MVNLGLGCVGIGRKWGFAPSEIPSEQDALKFLHQAYELGITYFDTAPAYGYSEQRLGKFLKELGNNRDKVTVATKFGEFYDFKEHTTFRDHSYEMLKDSVDLSLVQLGKIDILQIHGTTVEILQSKDMARALEYTKSLGIPKLGASVTDPESAKIVSDDSTYQVLQIPHNKAKPNDPEIFKYAISKGKLVVINRPFFNGQMVAEDQSFELKVEAFEFILKDLSEGIVLTGTKSIEHLKENMKAFDQAKANVEKGS